MDTIDHFNSSGFIKLPEQVEMVQNEAFNEGYQAAINDVNAGCHKKDGLYRASDIQDFLDIYKIAIRQSIQEIRGLYRLGSGQVDEERLFTKITAEADYRYGQLHRAQEAE